MPSTYSLIKGETLASTTSSYTFTAIPSTFTDLVVRGSARSNAATTQSSVNVSFNGSGTFSFTYLIGTGSSAVSGRLTARSNFNTYAAGNTSTANTFSAFEFYLPNYTSGVVKPFSNNTVFENNATAAEIYTEAALSSLTVPITSITFTVTSFVAGSSFYLYGIKNS